MNRTRKPFPNFDNGFSIDGITPTYDKKELERLQIRKNIAEEKVKEAEAQLKQINLEIQQLTGTYPEISLPRKQPRNPWEQQRYPWE